MMITASADLVLHRLPLAGRPLLPHYRLDRGVLVRQSLNMVCDRRMFVTAPFPENARKDPPIIPPHEMERTNRMGQDLIVSAKCAIWEDFKEGRVRRRLHEHEVNEVHAVDP